MRYTDLAVDVRHEDHGGVGAATSLTIAKRRRGHPSGLDSLPLFPGCWPFPLEAYDRRTELTTAETSALNAFVAHRFDQLGGLRPISGRYCSSPAVIESLDRLVAPLHAVLAGGSPAGTSTARPIDEATVALVLERMQRGGVTYWGWPTDVWLDLAGTEAAFKAKWRKPNLPCRPRLAAIAYVLGGVREIVWAKDLVRSFVFGIVFGLTSLREATTTIQQVLQSWGYADPNLRRDLGNALATVLLLAGSPRLDSLRRDHLALARRLAPSVFLRGHFLKLSRALAELGLLGAPLAAPPGGAPVPRERPHVSGRCPG